MDFDDSKLIDEEKEYFDSDEEKALQRFVATGKGVEIVGDKEKWENATRKLQEEIKKEMKEKAKENC